MQSKFKYFGIDLWMAVSFALGLAQAWRGRFHMNLDGISYLDMGDAYLRGDWHTAINGYFNPLYAWMQAFARFLLRPSMYWEYPVVHLVNLGVFVAATFAFDYFPQGLLKDRDDVFAIRSIAYAIFLWSSLRAYSRVHYRAGPDRLCLRVHRSRDAVTDSEHQSRRPRRCAGRWILHKGLGVPARPHHPACGLETASSP